MYIFSLFTSHTLPPLQLIHTLHGFAQWANENIFLNFFLLDMNVMCNTQTRFLCKYCVCFFRRFRVNIFTTFLSFLYCTVLHNLRLNGAIHTHFCGCWLFAHSQLKDLFFIDNYRLQKKNIFFHFIKQYFFMIFHLRISLRGSIWGSRLALTRERRQRCTFFLFKFHRDELRLSSALFFSCVNILRESTRKAKKSSVDFIVSLHWEIIKMLNNLINCENSTLIWFNWE